MPVPKRKKSKSRKGMRRAHIKVTANNSSNCPRCKTPKLPHHVCQSCGFYRERDVLKLEDEF